ncbi:MAG: trimethylamine corrinoid protein 2, partial [Desulfuromonadales bacterium]|nr:trimethylamine corrinoid protein 2 [Desulfuromonadales bacterium]
ALPHGDPNLGPEVFSAFFGTELEYGEYTSWSIPNLLDWKDADKLQFSDDNFYWKKINEITDVLLEKGRGKFYTGITDLHPGGDAIVAFRDPLRMNIDILDNPDEIKCMLRRVTDVYKKVFAFYADKLMASHQPLTNWSDIVSTRRWYVPSNDFSCMVSKEMFDEFFLPGIQEECRMLEASLYHLDGPNALQHLDSLLQIKELNAIQWVYGAGNGRASDWMHLYKKIQAAGKGIQLNLEADELDYFMRELSPNGIWLKMVVGSKAEADALLKKIATWR